MAQYRGLNYLPILAQNLSPPSSSRSRLSIARKRSQRSFISYNGNYEGDISMFKDKGFELERLSLLDTESDDNDVHKALVRTKSGSIVKSSSNDMQISLMWRLFQYFMLNFLKPDMQHQIVERLERIQDSVWYRKCLKCYTGVCLICAFITNFVVKILNYLAFLGHLMWTRRLIFRNTLRSILWWLTLAKCSDLALFTLILMCVPVLFVVALMGFTVALCGCLRDTIQHWSYIIKFKLI